jgi:predicted nucleic acid-binding Zn ribbon protein
MPVGIVFKGSGFYATDHRSPSGANRSASKDKSGETAKGTESSGSGASESKEKQS